ncbi:MAG TPA: hypothetical protein VFD57_01400, partial [Clostridia bacterium]|nr:hypothetical protein [Clostridia bacterium]
MSDSEEFSKFIKTVRKERKIPTIEYHQENINKIKEFCLKHFRQKGMTMKMKILPVTYPFATTFPSHAN